MGAAKGIEMPRSEREPILGKKAQTRVPDGKRKPGKKPVWEMVAEIGGEIRAELWAEAPDDASINYRHYLSGATNRKGAPEAAMVREHCEETALRKNKSSKKSA